MRRCRIVFSIAAVAAMSAARPLAADTQWMVSTGEVRLLISEGNLAAHGVTITRGAAWAAAVHSGHALPISPASTLSAVQSVAGGGIQFDGAIYAAEPLVIQAGKASLVADELVIRLVPAVRGDGFMLEVANRIDAAAWLVGRHMKAGIAANGALAVESAELVMTDELAAQLGRPELAGVTAGALEIQASMDWAGGDLPAGDESGAPRAPTICPGQPGASVGADVILGVIHDVDNYGSQVVNGTAYAAFAIGTISCNLGDVNLNWITNGAGGTENRHPVIGQNMFRLKTHADGSSRLEQIGQAWLKHGFTALSNDDCCTCSGSGGGSTLGIGCSDPYGAGLNGGQSGAGPKYQVNAFTGIHQHPIASHSFSGNVARRLQVRVSDLDPAQSGGGIYFVEGQYVASDDAAAGNQRNNASYRRINVGGSGSNWTIALHSSPTQREEPGIRAWQDHVPDVTETTVDIPGEGRVIVASRASQTSGGLWHYEYAIQNICSDRSIGSFIVPIPADAVVSNVGFHDVEYHNGEPFDGTDWTPTRAGSQIEWATTPHASNPNANAIRWGTMYNFRFDANAEPTTGEGLLGLFKPGTPGSVTAGVVVPGNIVALSIGMMSEVPQLLMPCTPLSVDLNITPGAEQIVPGSEMLNYRFDEGEFKQVPLVDLGAGNYRVDLPPAPCGGMPEFYISASGDGGGSALSPLGAPANVYSYQVGVPESGVLLDVDFTGGLPAGWTASGLWNVTSACPVNPMCGAAPYAYYGNTSGCNYNSGTNSGILAAPPISLPVTGDITLTYCSNLVTENLASFDVAAVLVNGTMVDEVPNSAAWQQRTVDLTAFGGQTITLAFSFDTVDSVQNNFRGWQIDNVLIRGDQIICPFSSQKGDLNGDGAVNGLDVDEFVEALLNETTSIEDVCSGDFNEDGHLDFEDVTGMVDILLNQ